MSPEDRDADLLRHAANLLAADAADLCRGHNVDPQHPDWKDEPEARAAYDDALCTALRLRLVARRLKAGKGAVSPAPTLGDTP